MSDNNLQDTYVTGESRGYGVLRELDLTDVQQPLEEVRRYVAACYKKRFQIDPRQFEQVVADVFANLGYQTRVTAYSGDNGIDVILDGPNNETIGVQVDCRERSIDVEQIRAFTGALFSSHRCHTRDVTVASVRLEARAIG